MKFQRKLIFRIISKGINTQPIAYKLNCPIKLILESLDGFSICVLI